MRKYKKRELLSMLNMLRNAGDVLALKAKMITRENLTDILIQCQQGAIMMGECIEEELGAESETVKRLEEYCELLYQIEVNVSNYEEQRKIIKKSKNVLGKIQQDIKYNIPDSKKEIVFLPYKASMWDSMESIWRAAKEDESCVCYVMPIPYYDKNENNEFDKMYYEKEQYPDYVDAIGIDEYSIQERKPDVIYIHYPYEDCNYVTSVHPMFYARELKKYTECLVYVPYFYTEKELPDSHLRLPAYAYVDTIVVQNTLMKKQLEKVIEKEKIAVLGSPKLDRVLDYAKKKEVPEQLRDYIDKRKILLLNTSISFLLKNTPKALKKIYEIMEEIKYREDVVLVWRPHPLLEATIKSMRSDFYNAYLDLKEWYIRENVGIYDSGMDLDMLVSCADAYIGEETSSIVVLFKSLGKPIYIISTKEESCLPDTPIGFFDFVCKEDRIYFAHPQLNVICVGDINTGVVDAMIRGPKTEEISRAYTDICMYNEELFFAPMAEKRILKIDMKSSGYEQIELENPEISNFNRILRYKHYIYFIPTNYDAVLRYDCISHSIKRYTEPIEKIRANSKEIGFVSMFASCLVGKKIYIASPTSNHIAEFDLESEITNTYEVGVKNSGYWDMLYDGKDFWLNPYKGTAIVRWNKENNVVNEYDEYPEGFLCPANNSDCFIRLVDCGKVVMAFPKCANMIIQIDKETGKMHRFNMQLHYQEGARKDERFVWPSNYYFAKRIGEKVYAVTAYDNSFLEIDYMNCTYKSKAFVPAPHIKNELLSHRFSQDLRWKQGGYVYRESEMGNICNFIDALIRGHIGISSEEKEQFCKNIVNADGTAGWKIHQYIMEKNHD